MNLSFKNIFQSAGLKQSMLMAVGNVGASGFSAISLIILSRYLGPQSFGSFSVAFSLSQLVARIGDLGVNLGIQKLVASNFRQNPGYAATVIRLTGWCKLAMAITALLLGLLAGPYIGKQLFNLSDPRMAILGVSLASVIILYEYITATLQAIARFTQSIILNSVQAIIKCSMAFVSLFWLTPNGFVSYLWYGLAPLVAAMSGWFMIPKIMKQPASNQRLAVTSLIAIAKFSSIAVFAAALSDNIDVLMVKTWLSEYQTGLYSAASRVALMVTLVGLSFGTVFNTRAAQYKNEHHMTSFLTKSGLFALFTLLLIPVALLVAKPLLILTAGTKFLGALGSMNLLMAGALVTMASMPFIAVFYAADYPAYFAISGIIQTIVLIACNAVLIPRYGIEGAATAKLITRVIITLYTIIVSLKIARTQFAAKPNVLQKCKLWVHHAFAN